MQTISVSNCQHLLDHRKSKRILGKASTSASLTTLKPLTVWITTNCEKFWKRWEYQITLPAFWETCMQVKKQQLEPDMEQQTGSKLGKEYIKAVYCHPAYLTSMQSTSCETLGWKKHKLESRLQGEISITSDMQMTLPLAPLAYQAALVVQNSLANVWASRDQDWIPGSGRSLGEGNGNPLQYSCLENPMDWGVWQATFHGVAKDLI